MKEKFVVIIVEINYVNLNHCKNTLCAFGRLSLKSFHFSDCPFEEHAVYHPLCDYLVKKRGVSFIERVLNESIRSMFSVIYLFNN